ncbi:MAG: YhcH/YjgK/YiaL family protein [Fusobacteriaceae bacterium]
MIFGNINNIKFIENYSPVLQEVIKYLKITDFNKMNAGIHHPFGERDMLVQVIDLETKHFEEKKPEVHRKYVDVQYLVKGDEKIGFAIDTLENQVSENYNSERDILFYKECKDEAFLKMIPGSFAVFFPNVVHRPGCSMIKNEIIRKIVVKINVELLDK